LGRGIQHNGVTVFAGVAVQNIEHLASDGIDDVGLSGIQFLIEVVVAALQAPGEQLALSLHFSLFVVAERARTLIQSALQVLNLLLRALQLILLGSKLGLQLGLGLFALCRGHNRVADVEYAYLYRSRSGRALRPDSGNRR